MGLFQRCKVPKRAVVRHGCWMSVTSKQGRRGREQSKVKGESGPVGAVVRYLTVSIAVVEFVQVSSIGDTKPSR